MKDKKIRIGLFGFGCVGYGLYEVLQKTPALNAGIKKICVKDRARKRPIPMEHFTFNAGDILDDPEINLVVELIDDPDAAFVIAKRALTAGKAVVSANKKMIATHFAELLQLQREYGAPFLYEAACCASIPIIRNLEEYYDNELLTSLEGVVNGSTNYILTKMQDEQLPFHEALSQAQQLGFAESDPSLDVSGQDARFKLVILLAHAFGLVCDPADIPLSGIGTVAGPELTFAREKGLRIRLTAYAGNNDDGGITGFVLPRFIRSGDWLFGVNGVYNGVLTSTAFADTQFFVGKGAGAHPTAAAVLSDISAISYDYRYGYKKLGNESAIIPSEKVWLRAYVRCAKERLSSVLPLFASVDEQWTDTSSCRLTGVISLAALLEAARMAGDTGCIAYFDRVEQPATPSPDVCWLDDRFLSSKVFVEV